MTVGGVLVGAVSCIFIVLALRLIIKHHVMTICITIFACYLTFFYGEAYFGVSGIIAIVFLGVLMGNYGKVHMNPQSVEFIHIVLSFLQYCLETLLFIITGCYIGKMLLYDKFSTIVSIDILRVFIFYPLMVVGRYLMIVLMQPLLNRTGWPIEKTDIIILTYGGLRGSLALCLALMIAIDQQYT